MASTVNDLLEGLDSSSDEEQPAEKDDDGSEKGAIDAGAASEEGDVRNDDDKDNGTKNTVDEDITMADASDTDVAHIPKRLLAQLRLAEESASDGAEKKYDGVMRSAALVSELDELLAETLYIELRRALSPAFPELDTLVGSAAEYARVAGVVASGKALTPDALRSAGLANDAVITVSVVAGGAGVSDVSSDTRNVLSAAVRSFEFASATRQRLLKRVEGAVAALCPNLAAIVGSEVAARLVSAAGGLSHLAALPAGTVLVLGKRDISDTRKGAAAAMKNRHDGAVTQCDLVRDVPEALRRKAARIVAGKAVLAARVDAHTRGGPSDAAAGEKLRDEVRARFEQMQQRPDAKTLKPLPVPGDEARRRHRAGARARKLKQRTGLTEAWRLRNRVAFGVDEEPSATANDLDAEPAALGMLPAGAGRALAGRGAQDAARGRGITQAGRKKLERERKREGVSEADRLGITSDGVLIGSSADAQAQKVEGNGVKSATFVDVSTPFFKSGVTKMDRLIVKKK